MIAHSIDGGAENESPESESRTEMFKKCLRSVADETSAEKSWGYFSEILQATSAIESCALDHRASDTPDQLQTADDLFGTPQKSIVH
jgi:hypothetical protein